MPSTPLLLGPLDPNGPFPAQSRALRLAIVGGGGIARVHAWAARLSERWDVVAVVAGADPARAREIAARAPWQGIRAFDSYEDLIASVASGTTQIDAIAITVPNHLHYDLARRAVEAGVHVLCEKPLAVSVPDAQDLAGRAKAANVEFAVCYPYACYPMVRQARHLVQSGALGRVRQIHVEFVQDFLLTQAPAAASSWRHDPSRAGAGSSADIGTHAFHLAEFVSSVPIEQLRAELQVSGPARRIDDTFYAFLRGSDGVSGTLWGTQVAAGITSGPSLRIIGDRGSLSWNNASPQNLSCEWLDQPAQTFTRGRGRGLHITAERFTRRGRGNVEGWVEAWANLYVEFALAVAARRDGIQVARGVLSHPTVMDGVRGVRFVDAMGASAREDGAWKPLHADDARQLFHGRS